MKKNWSPAKGFKGVIIGEDGAHALQDELNREAMREWARRPAPVHRIIPPMPVQAWKRAPFRTFISMIRP